MLAAPLMAGNDLRTMTPEDAIAINQDPLGKQAYLYMDHPSKQIWIKELSDGDWAICYFNTGSEPYIQRIIWKHYIRRKAIGTMSGNTGRCHYYRVDGSRDTRP